MRFESLKVRLRPGLCPRTPLDELIVLPKPTSWIWGGKGVEKGRGERKREGIGKEEERGEKGEVSATRL